MLRNLIVIIALAAATAVYAGESCCPPSQDGVQVAQAELPQGHPPVGETQMPAGHPPVGESQLPAGHPQLPSGHPQLPAGHPTTTQPAATTQPAGPMTVAVRAVQGTEGAPVPVGARVVLTLSRGGHMVQRVESKLDEHGVVVFEDLAASAGVAPRAVIIHGGVGYQAAGQPVEQGGVNQQLDVKVFETTTTPPPIAITMRHFMISPDEEGVTVSDVLRIENGSDRTWVAEEHDGHPHPTLVLPLPDEAQEVSPAKGFFAGKTSLQEGKLVTSTPVMSGSSEFVVVYRLPARDGKVQVPILTAAPCSNVKVFLPGMTDVPVTVTNLVDEGVKDMGSARVHLLTAAELQPGQVASLTIGGFDAAAAPVAESGGGSKTPQVIAGIGVLTALLAGVIVMLMKKPAPKSKSD